MQPKKSKRDLPSNNFHYISDHSVFLLLHFLTFICLSFPYYSIFGIRDISPRDDMKNVNVEDQIIIAEYISNIATPVVAGFISDYAGTRYVLYAVNLLSVVSQLVVFFWIHFRSVSFEYLLMGRILYAVSFEGYFVASITLLARWCLKNSFSKAINLTLVLGEGVVYIIIYVISYNLYSDRSKSEDYLYWIILTGTIMVIISLFLTFFIMKLYSKIEYESSVNPKHLRSMWKSMQHVLSFKFFCLFLNFALISSSFNWFVQYYDTYLKNYFSEEQLANSQIFEAIPYAVLVIVSITLAYVLKNNSQRILYLMFGSFLILIANLYLFFSLHFNQALRSVNWILSSFFVVVIGIGYSMHYSVIYTCVPLLKQPRQKIFETNKEIGIKFGILRWVRSILNFFMFVFVSSFRTPFDNYWIASLFLFIGLILCYLLVFVYDRNLFSNEEVKEDNEIKSKTDDLLSEISPNKNNFDMKFTEGDGKQIGEGFSDEEEKSDEEEDEIREGKIINS